jgi:2-polyprenyl-3-methyl-5-hydroxy-6-metoxy-1,4-benzoquinol methylase
MDSSCRRLGWPLSARIRSLGSRSLRRVYTDLYHRLKTDHGPFDFYECSDCQSGMTYPMPSRESLTILYQSYRNGLPVAMRELMGSNSGELSHSRCVERICTLGHRSAMDGFTWIDIGAGGGEMAQLMAAAFPNSSGLAIDLHERPTGLPANVDWLQLDLNSPDFHHACSRKADVVYATAVWEHITQPHAFVQSM